MASNSNKDLKDNINKKSKKNVVLPLQFLQNLNETKPQKTSAAFHIPHRQYFETKLPNKQDKHELLV